MRKFIYVLLLSGVVTFAYGQTDNTKSTKTKSEGSKNASKKSPEEIAEKITNKINEIVKLTGDQIPKVKEQTLLRVNNTRAAKEKAKGNKEVFGQERKKIIEAWKQALKGILTPDQMAKLKAYKDAKKGKSNPDSEEEIE